MSRLTMWKKEENKDDYILLLEGDIHSEKP